MLKVMINTPLPQSRILYAVFLYLHINLCKEHACQSRYNTYKYKQDTAKVKSIEVFDSKRENSKI